MTIAICFIISFFPIFRLPFGGAVTMGKLLPLVFFTYIYGLKSGIFAGTIYGILQIMIFFHIPPVKTPYAFVLSILLDYMIPYMAVGLTAIFKGVFSDIKKHFTASIVFSYLIRFICSSVSGIVIWSEYVPKQYNIWIYSLIYNLIYIVPEILISLIVCNVLLRFLVLKNKNHTF